MAEIILIAIVGLCFGSFITMASWRLPKEKSLVKPPSSCPKCKKYLRPKDLIPVVSYLVSKGKCGQCGKKIGIRYPVTEIITAGLFVGNYFIFGISVDFFIFNILAVALMILIVSDIEEFIIPDSATIVTFLAAVAYKYVHDEGWQDGLIGAAICLAIALVLGYSFKKIMKKDSLGFGDVKFMAVSGFWLGFMPLSLYFMLSGTIGVIMGLMWKRAFKQPIFPFGPALAIALYVLLLAQ